MRSTFLMTVAVAALGTGTAFSQSQTGQSETGQAAQQPATKTTAPTPERVGDSGCSARMQEVSGGEFFTGATPGYRQHVRILGDLRDSAMQLQTQGLDDACLQVVEAMQTAIESFQGADAATVTGSTAARGDVTREQLEQRLVSVDASDIPINTARMEGVDLYSMAGEDIGNVEGFLMAQGKPTHMIVSHGGFWDIGDTDVAIPLDMVRWDPQWETFFAPLTDEQLDDAPDYDAGAWDATKNDEFYTTVRG